MIASAFALILASAMTPMESAVEITSEDGEQQQFFRVPDNISSASVGLIPGDKHFYAEAMWKDGQTWRVCTNGYASAIVDADLGPVHTNANKYRASYDWRPTVAALGMTPTNALDIVWSPSMFDFAVDATDNGGRRATVRFTSNGDGVPTSFNAFYDDGRRLYQPRSMRLTPDNYMGLVSSYAAYFERLYYGSEGQSNAWDVAVYGATEPGEAFAFTISNEVYCSFPYFDFASGTNRSVSSSRWLTEWRNLSELRKAVRDYMLSSVGTATATPQKNSSFIFRPGWLLDVAAQPAGGNTLYVFWASHHNPNLVYIGPTEDHPGIYQDPATDGFGTFPTFEWTANPIAVLLQDEQTGEWDWYQTHDWATKCVTLRMAKNRASINPCRALFEAVGYAEEPPLSSVVRPYDFGHLDGYDVQRYMTNIYTLAVSQFYDAASCWEDYKAKCWGSLLEDRTTRRLAANDYTGVNHLLAAMDRTYHVPSMRICTTNLVTEVNRTAEYKSDDFTIEYSVDQYGHVTIEDGSSSGNVIINKQVESNEVITSVYEPSESGFVIRSQRPTHYAQGQIGRTIRTDGAYFFPESILSEYGEQGTNLLYASGASYGGIWGGIEVFFEINGGAYSSTISTKKEGETGEISVYGHAEREYQFEEPICHFRQVGPTQPGSLGESRVDSSTMTALQRVSVYHTNATTHVASTNVKYKSENKGAYNGRGGLLSKLSTVETSLGDEVKRIARLNNGGFNPNNYAAYAPFFDGLNCHYELLDNYAQLMFESFLDDDRNVVTNYIFYTFENGTNNYLVQEWATTALCELKITRYNVDVTVYNGSGLIVSNVTEIGSEIIPQGNVLTTNEVPIANWLDTTSFVSGPHQAPVDAVNVPWYFRTTKDWYSRSVRRLNKIDELNVYETVMSGTGPDDPGSLIRTNERQDTVAHDPEDEEMGIGYDHTEEIVNEVMVLTPTSEAEKEGEGVVELTGQHMIRFVKTSDVISDIYHYVHWFNADTGKYYYDIPAGWPMRVADYVFYLDIASEITNQTLPDGGCRTDVDAHGDYKIMTCVDWAFKNLTTR